MWYKLQTNKKLTLNSQQQNYQILTNDDQMLILCSSYFITTVTVQFATEMEFKLTFDWENKTKMILYSRLMKSIVDESFTLDVLLFVTVRYLNEFKIK